MAKLTKCKACGKDVAIGAKACPGCGAAAPRRFSMIHAIGVVVLVVIVFAVVGNQDAVVENQMDDINQSVVRDAIEQYEIAKRQGDTTAICVHAGLVAAAQLQAKNEAAYRKWKATEEADCARMR